MRRAPQLPIFVSTSAVQSLLRSLQIEAADDLKLNDGQQAYAVIKASDVMIAID
jgi:molybdopterin-binding protein